MTDHSQKIPLAAEADLYRLLAENVLDYAVFVIDGDRTVRTWTAGAERLLGYAEAEILGESADRFFTPEDAAAGQPEREVEQALASGRGDDDRWHVRKDGSRFWSSGVLTPLRHEDGAVRGFAKIMRDRTDLKRAADEAAEALAYAESIVSTVREPLVVLDAGLRVRTANRAFYRAFEVSPEETEGRRIYDLGNGQWDIPKLRTLLEEILPGDTAFEDFEVDHAFEGIGRRSMRLNARKVYRPGNHSELILLAIEDVTERRRLEAERRELETRFTSLVRNIKDHAIFTLDPEGKVTSWNVEAERILGYPESAAVGLDFSVIFTPEDIESDKPGWELRTAREQGRAEDERWHLRKDGERFWALGIVTPMYDPDGSLLGYSKILRDMTDRKRAEDRSRFQSHLLDAVGQAVIAADPAGTVLYWNKAAENLYGWSESEAVGRNVTDLVVAPEAAGRAAEVMARLGRGEPWSGEFTVRRKDGTAFPAFVSDAPIVGGDGRLEAIVGVSADLTERRRAEAALTESEGRLRALIDNLPDGAVYRTVRQADGRNRFTFLSAGVERLFGVTPERAVADPAALYDTIYDGDWDRVRAAEAEAQRTQSRFDCEFRHVMPGGEVRWVHARSVPRRTPDGVVWEGVLTDATGRKQAEAAAAAATAKFEAVFDQSPFYAGIMTPDGTLTDISRSALERCGYRREDVIGRPFWETGWWHGSAEVARKVRAGVAAAAEGRAYAEELPYYFADGTVRVTDFRLSPVRDAGGRVAFLLPTGVDVTDRKRAEESLRRSEQRFRGLMDQAPFSVQILSADGRTVRVNRAWEELWGLTLEQVADYNVLDDPQLEVKGVAPGLREAFAGRPARLPEITYDPEETLPGRTRNAEPVRWISAVAYPIKDRDGAVREVALVHEDITARRKAEAALRESERRSRTILESVTDAFFALDRNWDFTYLNPRAEELLGRADLVGKNLWVEFPEAPGSDFERAYRKAAGERVTVSFEAYYPSHDRWYDVNAYPSPNGLAVYFRDASERRRAAQERERLLAEAEAERNRLLAVVDNVPVAVILAEAPSGRMVLGNRQIDRIFRHPFRPSPDVPSYAEWVGYHPDGRRVEGHEWPLARALAGDVVRGEEYLYDQGDGVKFWIRASAAPIPDGKGGVAGAVVVADDIDAEKRAEAAIRRLAGQFRSLAAASATINSSLSKESVLQVVTEEARFVVGAHQAVSSLTGGERWAQSVNTVSLSDKYAGYRAYSREPDGGGIYALVCRTNGPMRLTQNELVAHPAWRAFGGDAGHPPMRGWLAAPLVGRDGRNLGLIQLSDKQDGGEFTEEDEAILVQLAQTASVALENARLYDELRDADRRKDEFLAMLAHELRNPLAPIRSGLDLLKMADAEPEVVEVMSGQVGHVVRLVDDLLDVSRILRGKVELKKEPTDLAAVLRRAAETVRPRAEEHRQRLVVSLPDPPIRLDADPVRLTQVVTNLLNNASKYTDDGGEVRLKASREGGEVVVRVSDTGIGIEPALLPKVFDLFTQADQALDRSQGGLGIGLTVVRSLVEMHGGSVAAASAGQGRGSEFTVRLPAAEPETAAARAVPADAPAGPLRILVVDDNAPAAKLLGRLLEKLGGHTVLAAHDGAAALAAAGEFRPDLVLLDIGLPRMDGFEVARRLRQRADFEHALLVALTGYGTAEDRRRSLEAGFDDHLVKPPSVEMLRKVLSHPKLKRH